MSNQNYYSAKEVAKRYGVNHSTIWRWVSIGKFPVPIKISAGCSRWKDSDLNKHDIKLEG